MFLKSSHNLSQKLQEHDDNMDNFWECTMIENLRNALRPYVKKFKDEVPVEIKGCKAVGKKKRSVIKELIKFLIDGEDEKMKLFKVIPGSLTIVVLLQQHVLQALLDNFNEENIAFFRLVGVVSLQVGTKYILESVEDTKYKFQVGFVNAVQTSNYKAIKFLLQQIGVNINIPIIQIDEDSTIDDFSDADKVFLDKNNNVFPPLALDIGATALMVACHKNDFTMMQLLLQQQPKPDPNLCTKSGWTALMYTAINGNTTILKALLDIKADVNMRKHSDGATAVMYASLVGSVRIIKMLVQHSADLNLQMNDGRTALLLASEVNNPQAVEELTLHAKAKPDIPSNDRISSLLIAIEKNHLPVAEKKLKLLTLQDNDQKPSAIASRYVNEQFVTDQSILIPGTTDGEDGGLSALKEKMNANIHQENEIYKQRLKTKGKNECTVCTVPYETSILILVLQVQHALYSIIIIIMYLAEEK